MLKTYIVEFERYFTQSGHLIIKAKDEAEATEIANSEDAYTSVRWDHFRTTEKYANEQNWIIRDPEELTTYRVILSRGIQPPACGGVVETRLSVGELPLGCDVWYITVQDRKHWELTLVNAYRSNDCLLGYNIVETSEQAKLELETDEKESNL